MVEDLGNSANKKEEKGEKEPDEKKAPQYKKMKTYEFTKPIDVVKERLQVQSALPETAVKYRSSFDALRRICTQEGFGAFLTHPLQIAGPTGALGLLRLFERGVGK